MINSGISQGQNHLGDGWASGEWVAFEEQSGGILGEGAVSDPLQGKDATAPGNPFVSEGLITGSAAPPGQQSANNQERKGNPFSDDESALSLEKPNDNAATVAPTTASAAAVTGAPPPVLRAEQPSAVPQAGPPAPTLPPTVAAAAAAAAALGGAAAPDAIAGQKPHGLSQGPPPDLDQLLKGLHQSREGTDQVPSEEAAELARIQRIRESWRGLVAPKAQRFSREEAEASSCASQSGTSAALRERAIPVNPKPRTSLELRMAAAEALHVARRASPTPESLFGVEGHLVQERPPSAPMAPMPYFPSPGPWVSSHARQQHSASVPTHSPHLSFLGGSEQRELPQDHRRSQTQDAMGPQPHQAHMQGGGAAAALQGSLSGATEQGTGGVVMCAFDAAGSALELRMAAAEAMAVTQRAAWEQQQQQQQLQQEHDARMEMDRAVLANHGLPARMPWALDPLPEAPATEVSPPAAPTPLVQAAADTAGPSPATAPALPQQTAAAPPPSHVAAPPHCTRQQRAFPPPPIPAGIAPPPPASIFSPPLTAPPPASSPPSSFPSLTAAYAQQASLARRPPPPAPARAAPPPPPAAPFAAAAAPPPSYEEALQFDSLGQQPLLESDTFGVAATPGSPQLLPAAPARPPNTAPAPHRSASNPGFPRRAAPPPPPSLPKAKSFLHTPATSPLPTTAQIPRPAAVAAAAGTHLASPQWHAPIAGDGGPGMDALFAAPPNPLNAPPSPPLAQQRQQQQQQQQLLLHHHQGPAADQGSFSVGPQAQPPLQRRAPPPPPPSHAQPKRAAPPPPLSTTPAAIGQPSPSLTPSPASSHTKSPHWQPDLQHNPFAQQDPFLQSNPFVSQQNPFLEQGPFVAQQQRNPFLEPPVGAAAPEPSSAAQPLPASPVNMSSISTASCPTSPPSPSTGAQQRSRAAADQERQALRQEKKQQKQQLLPPQELSSPIKHSPHSPPNADQREQLQQQQQQQQPPRPRRQAPPPPGPHRPPPPVPLLPPQQQQQQQQPNQPSAILTQPLTDGLPPPMGRPPIPSNSSLPPGPSQKHKRSRSIGSVPTLSPCSSGGGGVLRGDKDSGAQGAPLFADPANSCKDALCVEVRLPPMAIVKDAAGPKLLATGLGNLFCMPGPPGQAMLNWAEVHGHLGLPHGNIHAAQEDLDSTPCAAVPNPDPGCEVATSVHVDELASAMWTGHKNGKVCQWSIGQSRGTRCDQVWLAHREHKVVALALTPWGELWTGSTYGTIRVWACNPPSSNLRTPAKVFDVMRQNGDRPHSKLYSLACCSSGRTLWSLGRSQILLWDTYTGANLGALRISGEGPVGVVDLEAQLVWIDPAKGLDPSTMRRSFRMRAPPKGVPAEEDSSADEDEMSVHGAMKGDRSVAWGAKLTKGVGNVGKFAARMGKRTTKLAASVPQRFGRHVRTRSNGETYVLDGSDPLSVEPSAGSNEACRGPAAEDPAQGDKGKSCSLVATLDSHMIVAYKSGLVEKYTELGKRVWATRVTTQAVQLHSALLVARMLWLGCSDGSLRLVDAGSGRPHMQWRAHTLPVKSLAVMGTNVYSLAKDGSIRGWPAVQPPPPAAAQAWKEGARLSLRHHQLRVVAGTWNVNSTRPSPRSLYDWLGCHADEGVDLVCVGLQEVEMGTSSVATDAVRNIINRAALERGNANAQWWSEQLLSALGGPEVFTRVALRQMSGILVITFCRNALVPHVGEVATSSVACGLLGMAGNKGAAAISLSLYRRRIIFLSSHFAAHLEKLEERNADYTKIMRCLRFENTSASASANPKASAVGPLGVLSAEDDPLAVECAEVPQHVQPGFSSSAESMCPGLGDAEVVIWMGDFNYRLSATYEWAVSRAEAGAFAELLTVDQLRTEMGRGAIFHSLCEGPLLFAPTYKFDKGVPSSELRPLPYDSSDKKRVPAWTDRIFWRGTLPPLPGSTAATSHEEDVSVSLFTDGLDAVTSPLTPATGAGGLSRSSSSSSALANMWGGAGSSALSGLPYGAAMGVCDSDHKPVWCKLQLQLPAHVQQQKRRMSEQVLNDIRKELCPRAASRLTLHIESTQPIMSHQVPDDVPTLVLKRDEVEEVLIQNPGPAPVLMSAIGDGRRLPLWLEVQPTSCLVPPRGSVRFTLQAAAPDGACQGLGGGAAALRAQEVILRVWGQHLTSLGRGSGQPSHPLHYRSQSETLQPLLLRVQSLYY